MNTDRCSVAGSITLKYRIFCQEYRVFQTGGLLRQWPEDGFHCTCTLPVTVTIPA